MVICVSQYMSEDLFCFTFNLLETKDFKIFFCPTGIVKASIYIALFSTLKKQVVCLNNYK